MYIHKIAILINIRMNDITENVFPNGYIFSDETDKLG